MLPASIEVALAVKTAPPVALHPEIANPFKAIGVALADERVNCPPVENKRAYGLVEGLTTDIDAAIIVVSKEICTPVPDIIKLVIDKLPFKADTLASPPKSTEE